MMPIGARNGSARKQAVEESQPFAGIHVMGHALPPPYNTAPPRMYATMLLRREFTVKPHLQARRGTRLRPGPIRVDDQRPARR